MAEPNKAESRWIDNKESHGVPPVFYDAEQPPISKKILERFLDNPLVPIGLFATTACLTLGIMNLKRGDNVKQQFYMKGRVLAQGFTIAAMIFGTFLAHKRENNKKLDVLARTDS